MELDVTDQKQQHFNEYTNKHEKAVSFEDDDDYM